MNKKDLSELFPFAGRAVAPLLQSARSRGPAERVAAQDYHSDGSGKEPRYYQVNAINRVVEAVARKQDRILLVMATGTGKTYTAFRSSGDCGRPASKSAFCSWRTATSSSTRPRQTTSSPSAGR